MDEQSLPEQRRTADPLPAIRASDAERELVAEHLRAASATGKITTDELEDRLSSTFQARTRPQLEALISDLGVGGLATLGAPGQIAGAGPLAGPNTEMTRVKPGAGGERNVVSIMGGHARMGRWRVAQNLRVLNIMGGSELDFNDAELSAEVTAINVLSIMGGSDIRVPDGVEVHISNVGIMGGNEIKLGDAPIAPGGPEIRLRLVSIMGGCTVKRGRRKDRRDRQKW